MKATEITYSFDSADAIKGFSLDEAHKAGIDFKVLDKKLADMGFSMDSSVLADAKYMDIVKSYAQDDGLALGGGNIPGLAQFFQFWFTDIVNALYRGRSFKQTYGVDQVGDWTTETVVQPMLELTGDMALYDDFSRPPLAGYNLGWTTRGTVRFETGLEVTKLEEARAGVMRQNAYQLKKAATILKSDIWMNNIFWNGFATDGAKPVYGIFNEPGLATRKEDMTFNILSENASVKLIQSLFAGWVQDATNDLEGNFDPTTDAIVFNLPLAWQSVMTRTTEFGWSVSDWLKKQYPHVEIKYSVELNKRGTDKLGVAIVFVPNVRDVGKKTVTAMQTSALRLVGAIPSLKGMEECYSSSVAGVLISAPLAVKIYENVADEPGAGA